MTELIEWVRRNVKTLTQGERVTVTQENDGQTTTFHAHTAPLLKQLREAVTSNVGMGSGGGGLSSERNLLNTEAFDMYGRVERGAINLLAKFTPEVPDALPEKNILKASTLIHKAWTDGKLSEEELGQVVNRLSSWVWSINRILNPPTTLELMGSCPACGQSHAKINELESGRALIVERRDPEEGFSNALENCVALCRACQTRWRGDLKIRELAYSLEAAEVTQ